MEATQITNLVRRMQTGDQDALSELYDGFADRIYTFLRHKVSTDQEAEDLLQDVFVKAWRGSKSLQLTDLNFSAWLYRIATNTANDHYRKVYRRPEVTTLDDAPEIAAPDDTSRAVEQSFISVQVREALDRLPASYKQVLELRFFQEYSIEETAHILGKSSLSTRVLQHRALRKLEQLYHHNEREQ